MLRNPRRTVVIKFYYFMVLSMDAEDNNYNHVEMRNHLDYFENDGNVEC